MKLLEFIRWISLLELVMLMMLFHIDLINSLLMSTDYALLGITDAMSVD